MRQAIDLLTQYAEYHRDRRNITTHLVGVPMIVFAIGVLLARPGFAVGGLVLTPAWIAFARIFCCCALEPKAPSIKVSRLK